MTYASKDNLDKSTAYLVITSVGQIQDIAIKNQSFQEKKLITDFSKEFSLGEFIFLCLS